MATLKQIRKMSEMEVEAALDANDLSDMREYRQLLAARSVFFERRSKARNRFETLVDRFYRDLEDGTYSTRMGAEDDHLELVTLGERYGFDIPAEAL